ncbi:MAG: lipase family protein [Pseudanabaenales cyanobacterium]|nr:lipase family protein [Pseudanabaenales cyanobacterium]
MTTADTSGYNKGKYGFEQQTFCMSWATTLSFNFTGEASEIANQTKAMLVRVLQDEEIRKLIGIWDVVWGPGVYADSIVGPERSVNSLFIVVPQEDPKQAVVAIAGTNGSSLIDWILQDLNVKETVPWPYGDPQTKAQISKGIYFGLDNLVTIESIDPMSNRSITAQQFLASGSFTKVMVTGHSLGGALSPCYSLYLDETRSEWDASESATIRCLPTAGPTSGDINFSEYYDSKLLATTSRKWNLMDIVPHAFNTEMLGKIPDLYEPDLSSNLVIKLLVALIQQVTESLNYLNVSPQAAGFPSKYYTITDFAGQYKSIVEEIEKLAAILERDLTPFNIDALDTNGLDTVTFLIQALIQHTIGYIVYFDIGDFVQRMTAISKQSMTLVSKPTDAGARLKKALASLTQKPIFLDLGQRSKRKIDELKAGEGPLLAAILEKVGEINKGKPNEGAQTLIFLVEEDCTPLLTR